MEITSKNFSYMRYEEKKLTYEDYIRACQDIGETADIRKKCLKFLRNSIQESEDINHSFDDEFLLRFLRVSKFDCPKAFDRFRRCYMTQKKYKDYFLSKTAVFKTNLACVRASPYRMKGNVAVTMNKYGRISSPQGLSLKEKFYLDALAAENVTSHPVNQICGLALIIDGTDFSISDMLYYTPRFLRMCVECMQSYSARLKTIYVVNTCTTGKLLFNIFYAGFSRKLRNRIHLHSKGESWDLLHSHIPPEFLPEEYGGVLKSEDMINLLDDIHSLQVRFHKNSPVDLSSGDIKKR